jgi:hypothetical protein
MRELDAVLRGLDESREFARTYRFEMTEEYRALIARVEALPRNRPGADKSGRWLGSRADAQAALEHVRLSSRAR